MGGRHAYRDEGIGPGWAITMDLSLGLGLFLVAFADSYGLIAAHADGARLGLGAILLP